MPSPYRPGRSLQTVEAQPYFNVSQASLVLEGIVFDRNNNLLFVDVATGRVFKLTPERQLSIVLKENSFGASGTAVHKDGRIFIASVGDMQRVLSGLSNPTAPVSR